MILDELGLLRGDGLDSRVTEAGEVGHDSLEREEDTGQAVIPIYKTGTHGIPIVVITDDDEGDYTDGTYTLRVTIEASDAEAFDNGVDVVASFPAIAQQDKGTLMVRRVHTQKRYLRSVIEAAGGNGGDSMSVDFLIFIGHALMDS